MNRKDAKILSQVITNQQIFNMLKNAKGLVPDWTKASKRNKGISRGSFWNIFAKNLVEGDDISTIVKYTLIHEFGEYLPDRLKIPKKVKAKPGAPTHFDPDFTNWD